MPRYAYRCESCEHCFEIVHSMSEKKEDCPSCKKEGKLIRIPSSIFKKTKKEARVGDVVKQFIKDASAEVKEEKERIKKEEHKP